MAVFVPYKGAVNSYRNYLNDMLYLKGSYRSFVLPVMADAQINLLEVDYGRRT